MIYVKPSFYDKFKCIASACTDNCCIGWEIDVDEKTLSSYEQMGGSFGNVVRSGLTKSDDGSTCFKLCQGERCVFLNKDNLCDIITNCGEESLCDICREHPRFYEWFPGVTECGLGLCCEEACRLLLQESFALCEENNGEEIHLENKEDVIESDRYIFISAFRESLFDILSADLSFEDKLLKVILATEKMTGENFLKQKMTHIVEEYKSTEPIDESWTSFITELSDDFEELNKLKADLYERFNKDYSNVLAYLLYRHLVKAVFDEAIIERVKFCINAVNMIILFDAKALQSNGEITITDRINSIKLWSKQIEYSEENTDYLIFGSEDYGE